MQSSDEALPSTAAALLQLARLKARVTQREVAERAGVPVTMISAYERGQRQPTLKTLLRLLRGAGFELRMQLTPYDSGHESLADPNSAAVEAWRQAAPTKRAKRRPH
jgi:transcriptional regulator with XRE-family HTH domain